MSDELLIGIDVQGAEKIAELSKNSAEAKAQLASLQKEAAILQKELNKLTQGTEEYNTVLTQIAQKQVEVTNAKLQNVNATKALTTSVNQLTTSTFGLTQAEIEAQVSFQALITSLYAYQNSAEKSDEKTAAMINSLEVYTGAAAKAATTSNQLGGVLKKGVGDKTSNNLMLQFNQVLRETPNFAIDARIGILSLSNNLPLLADAFQRAREAGQSYIQILKTLTSTMLSFQGVLLLLTVVITALANPKFIDWFKSLFGATKDLTTATYELADANKELYKSLNSSLSIYGKAVEEYYRVNQVLKLAKQGFIDTKDALNLYNKTLGESLGKADNLGEAIDTLSKKGRNYIQVMLEMSKAEAFSSLLKDINIESAKLDIATKNLQEALDVAKEWGNASGIISSKFKISAEDLKIIFSNSEEEMKKFVEQQKKYGEEESKILNSTFEDYKKSAVYTIDQYNKAQGKDIDFYESYRVEKNKQLTELKKEEDAYYEGILNSALKNSKSMKNEQDRRTNSLIDSFSKQYETTIKLAKKFGIDLFKDEKETTDKINEYSRENKFVPKSVDLTEFRKQLNSILNATTQYTEEQKVLLKKAEEYTLGTLSEYQIFYGLYKMELIKFNLALDEARLEDLKKQKEVDKDKLDDINLLIQVQRDLYNLDLTDTQNSLRAKENALNEDYIKQAELENKLAKLKKDLSEEKDKTEKEAINSQIATTDKLLQDTERRISGNEKSVKQYKDELKALEDRRKELEKNVDTAKDVAEKLAEVDAQIADTTLNIVKGQKDKIQETLDTFTQFADAFADLFSAIGDAYQTNMDITNQNYDLEKKRIEESNLSEKAKNDQLKQLENDRYEALKKDFERSKKAREAEALINMASGIVSIWAHSADLGPILGPILATVQTAALVLTAKNNIKKIRAEKLEAPSGSANSNAVTPSNTAVIPTQTSLTSPQQNLNTSSQNNAPSKVLVTDINSVQNKVAVRDNNRDV